MNNDQYRPRGKKYLLVNDNPELKIDEKYLARLRMDRSKNPENKCTLCLHNDVRAKMHEMVNVYAKSEYIRPHYHPDKTETKIILEGKMLLVLFEQNGDVRDRIVMSNDKINYILMRLEKGIIHTGIPLSDVIFYESTTGPYVGKDDSVFPAWAPDIDDKDEIMKLYTRLGVRNYMEND